MEIGSCLFRTADDFAIHRLPKLISQDQGSAKLGFFFDLAFFAQNMDAISLQKSLCGEEKYTRTDKILNRF